MTIYLVSFSDYISSIAGRYATSLEDTNDWLHVITGRKPLRGLSGLLSTRNICRSWSRTPPRMSSRYIKSGKLSNWFDSRSLWGILVL